MKNLYQKSALLAVGVGITIGGFMPGEAFAQAAAPPLVPPDFRHPDADDRNRDPCKDAKGTFGCFEVLDQLPGFNENRNIDEIAAPEGAFINVLNLIIAIVRGVIIAAGLIVVVLGGYRYMTAGGEASKVTDAKKWILAGLGGIILAILGQVLLDTISPQFSGDVVEPPPLKFPASTPKQAPPAPPPSQTELKKKAALEKEQAELIVKREEILKEPKGLFGTVSEENLKRLRESQGRLEEIQKELAELNQRLNK